MTDFILAYIAYASQGPQECLVAMCLPGMIMLAFGEKRKPLPAKPAPARRNAKRKPGKVAKVKPPKKAKAVRGGKVEAKETAPRETHKATPEEMLAADRYRAGRDRRVFDDNWN